jgi:hypothetical protein|tara:strand:+ start:92 stop:469 length:378 start_codon:yes stop_codon:yes gene_type:complete
MENLSNKVKLENVLREFGYDGVVNEVGNDFYKMFRGFVDFRIEVSGGDGFSCGGVMGCGSVEGFIYEVILMSDMVCDWNGCYRGDFSYEEWDWLLVMLEKNKIDKVLINEISECYKKERRMNDKK